MELANAIRKIFREEQDAQAQAVEELLAEQVLQLRHEVSVQIEGQRLHSEHRFNGVEAHLEALSAAASSSHTHCASDSAGSQLSQCSRFSADATSGDDNISNAPWAADAPVGSQPPAPRGDEQAQIAGFEALPMCSNAQTAKSACSAGDRSNKPGSPIHACHPELNPIPTSGSLRRTAHCLCELPRSLPFSLPSIMPPLPVFSQVPAKAASVTPKSSAKQTL